MSGILFFIFASCELLKFLNVKPSFVLQVSTDSPLQKINKNHINKQIFTKVATNDVIDRIHCMPQQALGWSLNRLSRNTELSHLMWWCITLVFRMSAAIHILYNITISITINFIYNIAIVYYIFYTYTCFAMISRWCCCETSLFCLWIGFYHFEYFVECTTDLQRTCHLLTLCRNVTQ